MNPDLKEILSLYKTAACLKQLPRQGWIQEGALVTACDSVAGHSFCVALVGFATATVLSRRFNIDIDKVVKMAVFHDLSESATGEIASGVKNWIEKKIRAGTIDKMEHGLLKLLLRRLPISKELLKLVKEFDAGASGEAKVVRFADAFDALAHAKERLNKTFPEYLERVRTKLRSRGRGPAAQEIGNMLAGWLSEVEEGYDSVRRREPWLN